MSYKNNLPSDANIRRILIIKWSALGDVVISTAIMEDICRSFPEATVDLNTLPAFAGLFENDSRFNHILPLNPRVGGSFLGGLRWLGALRRGNYDLIVDLQSNDRSQILMTLAYLFGQCGRYRLGNHPRFPYNVAPDSSPSVMHSYDRQRSALAAGGISPTQTHPSLYVPEERRHYVKELMKQQGLTIGSYAVLMPGCQAAGYLKRWGREHYAALAKKLHEAIGLKIVLVGAGDELEDCKSIEADCDGPWLINLAGQTQIVDLVPLCEDARLIVSNDTGTAHVASCTTTPMLVICGPTDPRRVKPVGDHVVAIQADCDCVNCYKKECGHKIHHLCMKSISVDMVFDKLKLMQTL